MKALVLAGGQGTRLRPLTFTGPKQLIPVANRPVLFRVLDAIRDSNITDIGIVVGDDTAEQIRAAVGDGRRWGVIISYIHQASPLGLAHAVKISQGFLGNEPFVMFLGNNIIQGGIEGLTENFLLSGVNCQIVLKQVKNPQQFGVVELQQGQVKRLSDLALMGIYFFDPTIFRAVEAIKPSARGELEITDAIQWLLDEGLKVEHIIHEGFWIDTGKMEDLLSANDLVLDAEARREILGDVDNLSRIDGRVMVATGARIIKSFIRGPVVIGENTQLVDAYIAPYTAIGPNCVIEQAEIARCIVLEGVQITQFNHGRIEESLIGRNVKITRCNSRPRGTRLMVADFSELSLL